MNIGDVKQFDRNSLLRYLAYLQVCPENSCHLQTLQDIQNKVINNEPVFDDEGIRGTGTSIHTIGTIYSLENRYLCVA